MRESKIGIKIRIKLLFDQINILFFYIYGSIKYPYLTLISKDISYVGLYNNLDYYNFIDSIIYTNSNYTDQPLHVRCLNKTKVHMLWYAQSWKPYIYKNDCIESDVPNLKWIRVDLHWVWTRSFADYLIGLGITDNVKIIGPIVWHLPEENIISNADKYILIFDANPFTDEAALGQGQITNYHKPENLFSFINTIIKFRNKLNEKSGINFKLMLKTKRGYNKAYYKGYFEYLDKLSNSKEIVIAPYTSNLYTLISNSLLVIAYPYTSPAYIADWLNVPSIYYDPTDSLYYHDFKDHESKISFCNNYDELYKKSISILADNISFHNEIF